MYICVCIYIDTHTKQTNEESKERRTKRLQNLLSTHINVINEIVIATNRMELDNATQNFISHALVCVNTFKAVYKPVISVVV